MVRLFRLGWKIGGMVAMAGMASATLLHAAPAGDQQVIAIEDARFKAQVERDVPALDHAIARDAIYIHANGILQSKAEYLKDVAEGRSRYRAIEAAERTVSLTGNVAVTHALVRLHVGTDKIILARTTGVYQRSAGRWLVTTWQSTPITAVASPALTTAATPPK